MRKETCRFTIHQRQACLMSERRILKNVNLHSRIKSRVCCCAEGLYLVILIA